MRRMRSRRPSPALIISIIALCVALGGSAYAAKKIGTKSLKNKAVTTKKVKDGAITESKLGAGAVTDSKLGRVVSRKVTVPIPDGTAGAETAVCLPGEKMVGGGARFVGSGTARDLLLISSGPRLSATDNNAPAEGGDLVAWRGAGANESVGVPNDTGAATLTVFALCLL